MPAAVGGLEQARVVEMLEEVWVLALIKGLQSTLETVLLEAV